MSYNNKKTITKKSTPSKSNQFCTVCFHAGKSETEYRSHYVKSEVNGKGDGGVVTCPLIKSIECRYCHSMGHTVKYCSMLKDKDMGKHKQNDKQTQLTENKKQKYYVSSSVSSSVAMGGGYFSNLMDDEENGENEENEENEERIELSESTSTSTTSSTVKVVKCWANVVAQVAPQREAEVQVAPQTPPPPIQQTTPPPRQQTRPPLPRPPPTPLGFSFQRISRDISWADYASDSDDDVLC